MNIDIVFATRNRADLLSQTLDAYQRLATPSGNWKIIVADNGSTDNTQLVLQRYAQSLPLTSVVAGIPGKNHALNAALPLVDGDLVIFTDDDAHPATDWLVQFERAASNHADFDIFGGQVLPLWPPGEKTLPFEKLYGYQQHYAVHILSGEQPYVAGAYPFGPNFAVRRRVLDAGFRYNESVGPAPGQYVMGSEAEFLKRLLAAGYFAFGVSGALVHHVIRPEQLTLKWLRGRAFRSGMTKAHEGQQLHGPESSCVNHVPRFLWRMIVERWLVVLLYATIRRKSISYWNAVIHLRMAQGWLYEACRIAAGGCDPSRFVRLVCSP